MVLGGSGGSGRVIDELLVGQWIVGVIGAQKIFGLYGLKGGEKVRCHACPQRTTTDDGM